MFRKIAAKAPIIIRCPLCSSIFLTVPEMREHLVKCHSNERAYWFKKKVRKKEAEK